MKKSLILLGGIMIVTAASAEDKKIVECRLLTSRITECKPYPSRFMYTENLTYGTHRHKLIISKTLPPVKKPKIVKVISVEDMIENNLKILEPVRYRNIHLSQIEKAKKQKQRIAAYISEVKVDLAKLRAERERLMQKKRLLQKKINMITLLTERKSEKIRMQEGESSGTIKVEHGKNVQKTVEETLKTGAEKEKKLVQKREKTGKEGTPSGTKKKKLSYLNKKTQRKVLNEYQAKLLRVSPRGKHSLRVQATAYTSHAGQTDKTPFLAAWNNRIRPGMKVIAVSRDLIRRYGLGNGKKVRIQGLPGYYTVRDKMNKRFTKRIDIYMGTNRRRALRWGRKRAIIYW